MGSCWVVAFLFVTSTFLDRGRAQTLHNIPLSINSDYRYEATVNMSSTDPQTLKFEISSSTGMTIVAGTDCGNCTTVARYDRSRSQSASDMDGTAQVSLPDGSASGKLIKEDCTLFTTSDAGWSYPGQTVVVANESINLFSNTTSGILGLGRNQKDGDFKQTIYYPWFLRNPNRTSFTVGMALNNPYDDTKDGGVLHWLHNDSSSFKGELVTVNAVQTAESDWVIVADSWSFQAGGPMITSDGSFNVALDPLEPDIFLPKQTAAFVYSGIAGSQAQTSASVGNVWSVPCDTKLNFSISVGGQQFGINEKQLVRQFGTECYGTLRGWDDASQSLVLLGSSFISSTYLVYTIGRHGEGSISFGQRNYPKNSRAISGAAIAGITVGSVALILVLGVIITWLIRRRMRKVATEAETTAIEPFTEPKSPLPPPESTPNSVPPSSSAYTTEFDHTRLNAARSWAGTSVTSHPVQEIEDDSPPEYTPQSVTSATSIGSPRASTIVDPGPTSTKHGYTGYTTQ